MHLLRKKGYSFEDISRVLQRAKSAVWNEFNRNKTGGRYDPKKAHHKAYVRRWKSKYQAKKIVENEGLRKFVDESLYDGQSPSNIAGRIKKKEKRLPHISKESIYRYIASIYGRKIEAFRSKKKRRRRGRRVKLKQLEDRTFIDKRPTYINERRRVGDAEADFIVSGRSGHGILLTLADRKIRVSFVEQILEVSIRNVHRAFLRIKKRFPELRSFTTDNDLLFRYHKELEKLLNIKIYFCDPYSSWQKGTIENTNKYIRKEIPKGSDISTYSKRFIHKIEEKLDGRFMEVLNHETPSEALLRHRQRKRPRSN